MKKIIKYALATSCVFALGSCGYSDEVLADNDHYAWVVAGNNEIKVNGEWVANAWNGTDDNHLTATSLKEVAAVSEDVAAALKTKSLKALYMGDVRLGVTAANWGTNAMHQDGSLWTYDGSYAIKAIQVDYDEEDETYLSSQWISDPKTAYVESLTPDTLFYPSWTEASDMNGFNWGQNPVCIGGAGVYKFIIAQYTNASAEGAPGFGAALVKLEEAEGVAPTKIETPFADLSTANVGVIGAFNGWASDIIKLTYQDGALVGSLAIEAGTEFKVRANDAWDASWGSASLVSSANFEDAGGNIKCVTSGTYNFKVVISATGLVAQIEITPAA